LTTLDDQTTKEKIADDLRNEELKRKKIESDKKKDPPRIVKYGSAVLKRLDKL